MDFSSEANENVQAGTGRTGLSTIRKCRKTMKKIQLIGPSHNDQYQNKFKELLTDDCSEERVKTFFQNIPVEYWNKTKNNPLHIAATQDNDEIVKYFISLGCNVNFKNFRDKTPVCVAIEEGNVKTFKALLDAAVFLDNTYYENHNGLLHLAAGQGNVEIVKLLLDAGADVDAVNIKLNSPLHLLACHVDTEKVQKIASMFLHVNANLNLVNLEGETPLSRALFSGNSELASMLIDAGADVSKRNLISQTLLHLSVQKEQFDLTRKLIEKGIDIDAVDSKNRSALCYAIQTGNFDMVKMLIDYRASTNFSLNKGFCPLHEAIRTNNFKLVEFLLTLKSDINLLEMREPVQGLTCLLIAAQFGRKDVAEKLIQYGADINAKSDQGFGVLYYAAIPNFKHYSNFTDYSDLMKILILKGAEICLGPSHDPNKISYGDSIPSPTTLDYILYQAKEEIIYLLIERGLDLRIFSSADKLKLLCSAMRNEHDHRVFKYLFNTLHCDISAKDSHGETLLHKAVLYQNVSSLKYLLKRGGNVNCQNDAGMTPLHLAIKCHNMECVRLLLFFKANLNCQILPLSSATDNDSNFDFHMRSSLRYCKPYTSFALLRMSSRNSNSYSRSTNSVKSYPTSMENMKKEIAHEIMKYIAILELLGEPVNQSNYFIIYSRSDLKNFYVKCKAELKLMQDHSICGSSLFEVLFKSENKSCHKETSIALTNLKTMECFVIYRDIIDEYCRRVNKSPELIDKLRSMKIES